VIPPDGIERVVLHRLATPRGEVQLQRRAMPQGGAAYEIIVNGVFLMAGYNQASERALARLALEGSGKPRPASPATGADSPERARRVLVGGLGMGFTLQEVLACPGVAAVDVVEVEEAIVAWNRRYFGLLNGHALDDPRVHLHHTDLARFLAALSDWPDTVYDAACLDVDNGPDWLSLPGNGWLYRARGLASLRRAMRPGGVVTVWSAARAPCFQRRLRRAFGSARSVTVAETGPWRSRDRHVIYTAVAGAHPRHLNRGV
jgi:hypothetical protein